MSHAFQINDRVQVPSGNYGKVTAFRVRLDNGNTVDYPANTLTPAPDTRATNDQLKADMKINANMPAYPQEREWQNDMEIHLGDPKRGGSPPTDGIGFTKREELAARNMATLLVNPIASNQPPYIYMAALAHTAIVAADALLEELKR